MRLTITLCLTCIFFYSCRKDSLSCNKEKLVGTYSSQEAGNTISISLTNQASLFEDDRLLETWLPYIPGSHYHNFYMQTRLIQDGCSFELTPLSSNYAFSSCCTQYYLTGKGGGRFEPNSVVLDYDILIEAVIYPDRYILVDSSFQFTYIKN